MSRNLYYRFQLAAVATALLATLFTAQPALAAPTFQHQADAAVCTVRYYLSPMVGGGKGDALRPLAVALLDDPERAHPTAWNYLYNPQGRRYALVVVATTNHDVLTQNSQLGVFPDVPLDTSYWDMTPEQIEGFVTAFSRFGIEPYQMIEESSFYYRSLEHLSRWITTSDSTIPTVAGCPGPKPRPTPAPLTCTIRYYISPMVGSGAPGDPVRPLVLDLPDYPNHTYATDWEIVYNPDAHPYAMVGVASPYHKRLMSNPQLGVLPDIPFETDAHEMSAADQALVSNVIFQFGMDSEAVLDETETYGDILYQMAAYVNGFAVWPGIPTPNSCPLQ